MQIEAMNTLKQHQTDNKEFLHQGSAEIPNKSFSLPWQVITFQLQ